MTENQYEFIDKSLFFPKQGILTIGDLHIGYDYMLRQSGVLIPERQVEGILFELKQIIKKIKSKGHKINKIVFLGDIKHAFSYEFQERNEFLEIIDFLTEHVPEKNIILIQGNHDTMDYSTEKVMKPYHIEEGIAFVHGHETYSDIYDKNVKLIVSGHLHPTVVLEESPGVKRENYKCFLVGKLEGKETIVLPSFLGITEGGPVNSYKDYFVDSFSIIPQKDILKFNIKVVSGNQVYDFGKVGDL